MDLTISQQLKFLQSLIKTQKFDSYTTNILKQIKNSLKELIKMKNNEKTI
jgi:hypothetical protein